MVIDGTCFSACTLVLGMIPSDRICVTPRARLGFHAAWAFDANGDQVYSRSGTASLWSAYADHVREWISSKGGLSRKIIFLCGRELASMYRTCR